MIHTIETRLKLYTTQELFVDSCVVLWSTYYRKTWKLWNNHKFSETEIYHQLMGFNLFTSAQVNSLINKVKTEHAKIKELSKTQLKQKKAKLTGIEKFIAAEEKNIKRFQAEITNLKIKLKSYNNKTTKSIIKETKEKLYERINKLTSSIKKKTLVLYQKRIKLNRLNRSIHVLEQRIKLDTFKLCFGSSQLLKQRPGNYSDQFRLTKEQKIYDHKNEQVNLTHWQKDWNLARNNIWISIGDKKSPQGNAEIQYDPETKVLKLRLTEESANKRLKEISQQVNIPFEELKNNKNIKYGIYRMQARFMEINDVEFCAKNQVKIQQAIANKQPITAKIMKKLTPNGKNICFYLQLSFEEILTDSLINKNNQIIKKEKLIMGIDLNQKGLAYCIIKADGNKLNPRDKHHNSLQYKPCGFIPWDLEDKTTVQRQWIISNIITKILVIAKDYGIKDISIENLDFSSSLGNMNSGYKGKTTKRGFNYNKMLSGFAKTQFNDMITRKTERLGVSLYLVNPAYSSVGGFSKYGIVNKLPADMAASLWLARQSLFGVVYKEEVRNGSVVRTIKKYKEAVVFPYDHFSKQSKREIKHKKEWKTIALALGKSRSSWYKNHMKYMKVMNDGVKPKVDETLLWQKELFSKNNEYNPFAINPS